MDVFSIAVGVALVGVGYFLYLAASKGLPAAWVWLKAKWNAGSTGLAALKNDLAALEQGAVADVKTRLTKAEADIAALKKPAAPAPAAAAPSFLQTAAAEAKPTA